jgi:hypothetical protein
MRCHPKGSRAVNLVVIDEQLFVEYKADVVSLYTSPVCADVVVYPIPGSGLRLRAEFGDGGLLSMNFTHFIPG